ncbi:tRNA-dihydrouridine(16/17) synthase [NAD(P)(+)]-like protein [Trebouxia sp. C0010 RCD-2024]
MASPILSAEACSLYDLRNVSGGYLRRQVLNVPPKTTYLSSIRRLVCTAVHGNFAEGVPSTSMTLSATDLHAQQAWEFWRKIGSPKYHVAPMVDQSELAFRQLCLRYGATAAYTPMLHSRLFLEDPKYRAEHFTTCPGDRPLFVQFCANNPSTLLQAAELVQDHCDAVDINLGCPQRIARKGKYGAFLMEQMELIESLVTALAQGLRVPVTCKIRVFPELERTLAYAHMLERAGCSVLAVHGRTREQKQAKAVRADWNIIKAVREAVSIPVLANGNIRHLQDVHDCIAYTGVQGVMSAESLLEDPALFWHQRLQPGGAYTAVEGVRLLKEYLDLAEQFPTPMRMVRGHTFGLIGPWLQEFTDLRDKINTLKLEFSMIREVIAELDVRIPQTGRDYPIPKISERALARMEREAALAGAVAEQNRQDTALASLLASSNKLTGQVQQAIQQKVELEA